MPKKQNGGGIFDLSNVVDLAVPFALLWSTKGIETLAKKSKKQKGGNMDLYNDEPSDMQMGGYNCGGKKKGGGGGKGSRQYGGSSSFMSLMSPEDIFKNAHDMSKTIYPNMK